MTEPLKPDEIARRDFEVTRRGFDQHAGAGLPPRGVGPS